MERGGLEGGRRGHDAVSLFGYGGRPVVLRCLSCTSCNSSTSKFLLFQGLAPSVDNIT